MFLIILIAFFSLIGLLILHELGHFILAKSFGVKVEEFGLGYPPRIFGKKIGETIYSLNLLPFGAFVRIYGQEKRIKSPRSFSEKQFWQKALIILGGVFSFWMVSVILLSIVMGLGMPTVITDEENHNLVNSKVQIAAVVSGSPADQAELRIGDIIKEFSPPASGIQFSINKVIEIQELTERHKGEEIVLRIERGKEVFDVSLVPRVVPPANEGPMGVALVRTALKSYPWYIAPIKGIEATGNLTIAVFEGWGIALSRAIKNQPTGMRIVGPVGVFDLFTQVGQLGINYFLQFVALVSIYIAIFNVLPIPVVDGGWFLFLVIEKLRRKPLNQKFVQNINVVFYFLLIALMVWVTIKDIVRLL